MGVAWITDIYQFSDRPVFIRSRDDRHKGMIIGTQGSEFHADLEDRKWHELPKGVYTTRWFGIPWFFKSEHHHYKIISTNEQVMELPESVAGVCLYTSILGGQDNIYYANQMGITFARTVLDQGSDTNCKLIFTSEGGFYIEPINTGDPEPLTILDETGKVVKATIEMVSQVTQIAAAAAPLFA
jgi:hypothetical protein